MPLALNGVFCFIAARKRIFGKVMLLHLSVILFTSGGGVSVNGGGVCPGGVYVQGDLCQGDQPRTVKTGRYASYWNACLFTPRIMYKCIDIKI